MTEKKKLDLDFYQIMIPIVNMILWEYGLKLVGDVDNCQLNCYDYAVVCGADVQNKFTVSGSVDKLSTNN